MQTRPEQFYQGVRQQLAPLYLLTADQPLFLQEARSAISQAAKDQGIEERIRLDVDGRFDWKSLSDQRANLSLFASRRLIDIRMNTLKPGRKGATALSAIAQSLDPQGDVLVFSMPRVDTKTQKTAWFKKLAEPALWVRFNPVGAAQLPDWLQARADSVGLRLTSQAAGLIATQVEGNLVAAAQEVEKLALIHQRRDTPLDVEDVAGLLANQSQFDTFALSEAILQADAQRGLYLLDRMQEKGVEPLLLLWVLARDIRALYSLALGDQAGFGQTRIPTFMKDRYQRRARQRKAVFWGRILVGCGEIDRCIKGVASGCGQGGQQRVWQLFQRVILRASR